MHLDVLIFVYSKVLALAYKLHTQVFIYGHILCFSPVVSEHLFHGYLLTTMPMTFGIPVLTMYRSVSWSYFCLQMVWHILFLIDTVLKNVDDIVYKFDRPVCIIWWVLMSLFKFKREIHFGNGPSSSSLTCKWFAKNQAEIIKLSRILKYEL